MFELHDTIGTQDLREPAVGGGCEPAAPFLSVGARRGDPADRPSVRGVGNLALLYGGRPAAGRNASGPFRLKNLA